jgi:UDP-N-acetylmuramoyl-L-alanyl-D-glutamate--2,6-diaminopimelate ligase
VITAALENCAGAPGRFERVPHDGDFAVVIDYAHSDDALLNVLRTARDVEEGIKKTGKPYRKIPDRSEAIHAAIAEARSGDLVLIAGKGHEDYQIIGRDVFHFDDKEVARAALAVKK